MSLTLQPRCEILPEGVDPKCKLRPDPKDSCCKVMYCPDPNNMDHDLKPVAISFDGCKHKNKTYSKVCVAVLLMYSNVFYNSIFSHVVKLKLCVTPILGRTIL